MISFFLQFLGNIFSPDGDQRLIQYFSIFLYLFAAIISFFIGEAFVLQYIIDLLNTIFSLNLHSMLHNLIIGCVFLIQAILLCVLKLKFEQKLPNPNILTRALKAFRKGYKEGA